MVLWGGLNQMLFDSKRSQLEIVNDILVETRDGIKKTQLMYKAKMSNTQLDRYLEKLIEQQCIEIRSDTEKGSLYYLTGKGENLEVSLKQVFKFLK